MERLEGPRVHAHTDGFWRETNRLHEIVTIPVNRLRCFVSDWTEVSLVVGVLSPSR